MNRFRNRSARTVIPSPLLISIFDPDPAADTNGEGTDNASAAAGGGGGSDAPGDADKGKPGDADKGGDSAAPGDAKEGEDKSGEPAKGDDAKDSDDDKGGKPDKDDVPEVPETYAAPEDLPDGIVFDEALATELTPLLRDAKVSQEAFSKIANVYAKHQLEQWENVRQGWVEASAKDPELNARDGELKKLAVLAFGKFGTPAAREAMVQLGWGDHPEILRVFGKAAKALGLQEDPGTDSAASGGGARSLADRMYGNTTAKK